MNVQKILMWGIIAFSSTFCFGHADVQTLQKTAVATCGGPDSSCSAVVNAIGDVVNIDVSTLAVTALGQIGTDKTIDIELPDTVGTQKVYSLTPTQGESMGKRIYIVLDNIAQRPGSRLAGKTVVKMYRQFEGDKKNQWIEVGKIETPAKTLGSAPVTFKPDGTAVWTNPVTDMHVVFLIGKIHLIH
jgi:hypothetical protein